MGIKGSDRLCKVVELSIQCCGKLLSDSFEKDLLILSLSANSTFITPTFGGGYVFRIIIEKTTFEEFEEICE